MTIVSSSYPHRRFENGSVLKMFLVQTSKLSETFSYYLDLSFSVVPNFQGCFYSCKEGDFTKI